MMVAWNDVFCEQNIQHLVGTIVNVEQCKYTHIRGVCKVMFGVMELHVYGAVIV